MLRSAAQVLFWDWRVSCFGGMPSSLWYTKVRGLVKLMKHVWNLCAILPTSIPLVRESHMPNVNGSSLYSATAGLHGRGSEERIENNSLNLPHFPSHMMRGFSSLKNLVIMDNVKNIKAARRVQWTPMYPLLSFTSYQRLATFLSFIFPFTPLSGLFNLLDITHFRIYLWDNFKKF